MSDVSSEATRPTRVVIDDIDIAFRDLILLFVKLALAAIPALLILALMGAFIISILMAVTRVAST